MSSDGGKEKKTRRRLRVSCVECTKRRQKCDRQNPCGLCVARNVAHLCRWETEPVARPSPARPPFAGSTPESSSTITQLSQRVASLERILAQQQRATPGLPPDLLTLSDAPAGGDDQSSRLSGSSPSSSKSPPQQHSPEAEPRRDGNSDDCHFHINKTELPIQKEVHDAAVTLAQLSLARPGEYIGRGTIVCAVSKIGGHEYISGQRVNYARSTSSTLPQPLPQKKHEASVTMQNLFKAMPPRADVDELLRSYFSHVNWRFGVPERWFRTAYQHMWTAIDQGKRMTINVNWLALLYSMLALTPENHNDEHSFGCWSLAARRVSEDAFFCSEGAAEGSVLSAFATSLNCAFLAERGLVSEAWKFLGGAIRAAEAVGMHRDPAWVRWRNMSEEEQQLRTRGWWGLVVWDRMYSNILGRPSMTKSVLIDVPTPKMDASSTLDLYGSYQAAFVRLSEIISEMSEICHGTSFVWYTQILALESKFDKWRTELPAGLRSHQTWRAMSSGDNVPTPSDATLAKQSWVLTTWYLAGRVHLHRSYLTQLTHKDAPLPQELESNIQASFRDCFVFAMELMRIHCHNVLEHLGVRDGFSNYFFLYDATVSVICLMNKTAVQDRSAEAETLVDKAVEIITRAADAGQTIGDVRFAQRSVAVLNVLCKDFSWRCRRVHEPRGAHGPAEAAGSACTPAGAAGGIDGTQPTLAFGNQSFLRLAESAILPGSYFQPMQTASQPYISDPSPFSIFNGPYEQNGAGSSPESLSDASSFGPLPGTQSAGQMQNSDLYWQETLGSMDPSMACAFDLLEGVPLEYGADDYRDLF